MTPPLIVRGTMLMSVVFASLPGRIVGTASVAVVLFASPVLRREAVPA
jgi:hypothetical protein